MQRRFNFLPGLFLCYLSLAALVFLATSIEDALRPKPSAVWGVTFLPSYAEYLGADPQATLTALLDDLKVRHFRLTIPWDRAEPSREQFSFSEIEWQLDELKKRGADAVVAIGRRTPRWPECHDPEWIKDLSLEEQDEATLNFLKEAVTRLRDRPEIIAWQVENEPFLSVFGLCPTRLSRNFFDQELKLVSSLDDSRPIMTTDSGELSTWFSASSRLKLLGISIYKETYNRFFGKIIYPLPPAFYRRHAELVRALFGTKVIVSELQAEPWSGQALPTEPIEAQIAQMDPAKLKHLLEFARATGFDRFYLWGAEWWFTIKEKGRADLWETVRPVFAD